MSLYAEIKSDHDRHRDLMKRILNTSGDSAERQTLWQRFRNDLEAHAAAEEQSLYAELIAEEQSQPQARHSVAEHKESSDLVEKLDAMEMSNPAWLQAFQTLANDLEHHMSEEEQDVFDVSKAMIGDTRAEELATRFRLRKQHELEDQIAA
jgi:iron-sulfur cluster repair protein YtfE (RIC family)